MELAADCADRAALEALIFRTYQKDLRNLALQERRLRNQLKEDTAELRRLQQERLEAQTAAPKEETTQTKPVQNGFEFSTPPELLPIASGAPEPTQPAFTLAKSEAIAA